MRRLFPLFAVLISNTAVAEQCPSLDGTGGVQLGYADGGTQTVWRLEDFQSAIEVRSPGGTLEQTQITQGGVFLEEVYDSTGRLSLVMMRLPDPSEFLPLDTETVATFEMEVFPIDGPDVQYKQHFSVVTHGELELADGCTYPMSIVEYVIWLESRRLVITAFNVPSLMMNVADVEGPFGRNTVNSARLPLDAKIVPPRP
jgi:hypothetical protein